MSALNGFGFIPSNNFVNKVVDRNYPYITTLFEYISWEDVWPRPDELIVPSLCQTTVEYQPGAAALDYWDFTQLFVGYPSFVVTWQTLPTEDWGLIRQAYSYAYANTNSRVWLTRLDGETQQWEMTSGILEPPEQGGFNGDSVVNVKLTFSRLAFHLNDPTDSEFEGIAIFGNKPFEDNDWNY